MRRTRGVVWLVIGCSLLMVGAASGWADTRPGDARLQALALEKLSRAKVGDKVALRVEDGLATLDGSVDSIGLKQRAGKEVSKVNGISKVSNNIQVTEGAGGDTRILDEASRRVRRCAYYTIFDNIELAAEGGHLKLLGQVSQPWRRSEIESIVAMVPGVREIDNNLEVLPLSPYDDQIRRNVALAIYKDPILYRYGIQANPPIHIIVRNGSVTLTGVVNTELEKAVAERAARFAAIYFDLDNRLRVETQMAKATP